MTPAGRAGAGVVGAVLAGGASRRMGTDKALLDIGGRSMASRVVDALREAGCDPVSVIGGDERLRDVLGIELVADRWPGEGPLGGIITAIEHAAGAPVVVVACDLPWITGSALRSLVEAGAERSLVGRVAEPAQVVVAHTERLEPLCACWQPTALEPLVRALAAGRRAVHEVLSQLRVCLHPVDPLVLRNVNTPDDLAQVRRAEGTSSPPSGGSVPA